REPRRQPCWRRYLRLSSSRTSLVVAYPWCPHSRQPKRFSPHPCCWSMCACGRSFLFLVPLFFGRSIWVEGDDSKTVRLDCPRGLHASQNIVDIFDIAFVFR